MAIERETLRRARKFRRDAVEEVVNDTFAVVTRMAYGLTGRDDAGESVVRAVILRGLKQLPKWRDEGEPER
ncbi:MAG: hypothetical protein NZ561_09695, partial [Phycisphaerae bacterium]|nr:hypothetical protein [Phycisphaerae bacterium]